MKHGSIKSVVLSAVSSVVCTTTLILEGYDLLIIEDNGETPLSSGPGGVNYFPLTCAVIAAIIITTVLVLWLVNRDRFAKRLKDLNRKLDRKSKIPFFTNSIKEEIALAEAELGSKIFKNE